MPKYKNYYEIFQLYPPIDLNQLQDTYKQLIFEHHPDRNPDRQDWAVERTMEIVEGYNILSDTEKREVYNFQIRNDIRRDLGELVGVKRGLLKIKKTEEEVRAEEHFRKGYELFEDRESWNRAQHEWVAALRHVPGFVNAHFNLGILYGSQGDFKNAVACFERAVKCNPEDSEAKKALSMAMGYVYGKKV
jgi:tetratricopeptide (TPR) repeat protein